MGDYHQFILFKDGTGMWCAAPPGFCDAAIDPAAWGATREDAVWNLMRQREIRDRAQRECWPEITVDNFVEVRRDSLDNDAKERRKALKLIHGGKAYASGATLLAQLASCHKR